MPLYRHPDFKILIDYLPGRERGIGVLDFEKEGAEGAYQAMWNVVPGYQLGTGVLPIIDLEHFQHILTSDPVYSDHEAWLTATAGIHFSTEDFTRWANKWGVGFLGSTLWYGPKVRYEDKEYHVQEAARYAWQSPGCTRMILDPETKETREVPWKALVYLEDNAKEQVLLDGQVCSADPNSFGDTLYVTRPDGTALHLEKSNATWVADQPVGTPMLFEKRQVYFKWTTKPYALVYDPKIGADRKVKIARLKPVVST